MNHRVKIVASSFLFFGGIFLYLVTFVAYVFFWWIGSVMQTKSECMQIRVFGIIMCTIMLLCWIFESKKFFAMIHFTKDGVEFHTAFQKPILKTYKQYRNVVYASYWHGSPIGVGSIKWFIVISERKLSKYESEHINQIPISSNVLKIEYSKKRREKLMEILPQNMACQLKNPPPGKK